MIIKQVEQKEKRKGASRCPSRDGRDEQEQLGPGEKGRGDAFVLPATAVTKRNGSVSWKWEVFCPSLKGKGDRPYGRWIGLYIDHTTFYYHSGGGFLYLLVVSQVF